MQVTLQTLTGLERQLRIEIPADRIEQAIDTRLQKLSREVRINGFRPGKVPVNVVRQRYGQAVRGEVIEETVRSTYSDAINNEKLNPAGQPHIEFDKVEAGQPLVYTATLEVYPEFQLQDPATLSVELLKAEVTEADIDAMLEKLRQQQAEWVEVERQAQDGDTLLIDFEGYRNEELFQGGSAKDIRLKLGSGNMIPGFEAGLIGAKAGDTVTLELRFPKDYHVADLADQPAKFVVKVHKVLEPKLPSLDEAFAEKLGIKEGGIETLRGEVRSNMERELKKALRSQTKEQVLEKFLALHTIELPKVLVNNEAERIREQAKQHFRTQTGGREAPDFPVEDFRESAQQRVGLGLLFAEFIKQYDLKVDEQRVKAMVEEAASVYQYPEQVISWYYQNKQQLAQFESMALEEQAIDKLLELAKVTEKQVSYDEVMNPKQAEGE